MEPDTHQHQDQILKRLSEKDQLYSIELSKDFNITHDAIYAQLLSLLALKYITLEPKKTTKTVLSKFGEAAAQQGSPQARLIKLLKDGEGVSRVDVQKQLGESYKIAFGTAMRNKLVQLKEDKIFKLKEGEYVDEDKNKLTLILQGKISELDKKELDALKKNKYIEQKQQTSYAIKKGPQYRVKKIQLATQITSQMIATDSWKQTQFKAFNPQAKGLEIPNGNLHVLMKTRQQFKEILVEMGFQQMKTDRYVESCFWNFDSLFQPQAHPARDAHDTFFVSEPKQAKIEPGHKQYFEAVKQIHQKGGFGSKGYDCVWEEKQANKNILRTHTTAISARTLKSISEQKPFRPRKFFSIDRVFRNETLDNTHLAEFHQVEGFIIDRNLGLNHLIGILTQFYKKIGIQKIWLKPTYNPYTEPSMQIFGKFWINQGMHPILKKKVEIGNSGIFRPQMLRPMGFDEDVSVIAWGLGLQRPTMIQFGIENIKQLFGPGVSIKKVKDSPIYCV